MKISEHNDLQQIQQTEAFSQIIHTSAYNYRSSKSKSYMKKQTNNQAKNTKIIYVIAILIAIIIGFVFITKKCNFSSKDNSIDSKANQLLALQEQLKTKKDQEIMVLKSINQNKQKIISVENKNVQLVNKIKQAQILENNKKQDKKAQKAAMNGTNPNPNVVDIKYVSNSFEPLPINPIKIGLQNKGIADFLYKDDETRKNRLQFIQQRIDFVNKQSNIQSASLIKYNLIAKEQMSKEAIAENQKDWLRLQQKFKISSVKEELPMCIISSSYNNNARFRIQANLNSVFLQNYTNFKHVIISDASTDGSNEIYRKYYNFYSIDKNRYVYIENNKRITALENIYDASLRQCSNDSMVLVLDGDDELIGRNTLKLFNWGFQTLKAGVLYSNFLYYKQPQYIRVGFTSAYDENQRKNNLYRGVPSRISHLRAGRAELFRQLNPKDLQDDKGKFFTIDADIALFIPLMELSCERVHKIEGEFNLLYNSATGMNEYVINPQRQRDTEKYIRGSKKSQCFKQFNERMSKLP